MKWSDCLLVSATISTTLFTLYVLAGAGGEPVPGVPTMHGPQYRSIMVHTIPGCREMQATAEAHFLITASGEIHSTVLWHRRAASPSADPDTLVVCVERSRQADRQGLALKELVRRLREQNEGLDRVLAHGRLACGRGLSLPASRARLGLVSRP